MARRSVPSPRPGRVGDLVGDRRPVDGRRTSRVVLADRFDAPLATVEASTEQLLGALREQRLLVGDVTDDLTPAHPARLPTPTVGPGTRPGAGLVDLDRVLWRHQSGPFRALAHDFSIRSTDASVGRYLERVLAALADDGPAQHTYSVVDHPADDGRFALYLDDLDLAVVADRDSAVRHVSVAPQR